MSSIYIHCGRLIDVEAPTDSIANTPSFCLESQVVEIKNDKIMRIASFDEFQIPKDAKLIDLKEYTVLPGLIDSHVHPLIDEEDYQIKHLTQSSAYKALKGLKVVQKMLQCGWTTIRIAGDADIHYAHIDIKRSVNEGLFRGPRILAAGHYLSITGGGGDINFLSPECAGCFHPDGKIVDGPWQMRRAIREEVKFGSDWIKLLVTGAFMTAKDNPFAVHFTPEELDAAVDEARRLGRDVMAHAHSAAGIKAAIQAGVRSIEHSTLIDAECINLIKERNATRGRQDLGPGEVWIVPTLFIGVYYDQKEKSGDLTAPGKLTSLRNESEELRCLSEAVRSGLADYIVLGSDYVGWPVELNIREIECLVDQIGLTPLQAIRAATINAARMLRLEGQIGSIKAGKIADLIAVKSALDPLSDITALRKIDFVMHNGEIITDSRSVI